MTMTDDSAKRELGYKKCILARRLAGRKAQGDDLRLGISEVVATGLYSGYSPFAPGTAGSIAALFFWPLLRRCSLRTYLVFVGLLYWAGVITGGQIERAVGKRDPGRVVVDEFVGMYLTLAGDPGASFLEVMLALVYFRFFDIIKPWPANRFNDGDGGVALMTDDVVAGLYALGAYRLTQGAVVAVALRILPLLPSFLSGLLERLFLRKE